MKFFIDNCLPPRVARSLHGFVQDQGHLVVHLRDRFPPDTPDEDWIAALAQEGEWVVITADQNINKKPVQRMAWQDSGLTGFFLKKGWMDGPEEQAARLIKIFALMVDIATSNPPGTSILVQGGATTRRHFEIK